MQSQQSKWLIAIMLVVGGQGFALAGDSFIVGNKYRNPEVYIHQRPAQNVSAYGEVDPEDIQDRILQIEKMFPEIYSRFFTSQGKLKAGYQWIDYQKAIQAHYDLLKEDARKLYGANSSEYKQVIREIADEEFNLSVARYFDNKFGNFTSSRSNFRLNVIPVNMLSKLNAAGIRTASQLRLYAADIYRQYIGSKDLKSDFYLGPVYVSEQPQQGCQPISIDNPICPVNPASSAKDAAKAAAACAQAAGGAKTAAKIAAQTALQTGAGKKDAAKILSAIGDGLNLNAAERHNLANDFSRMTCTSTCNGGSSVAQTPVCVVAPGTNAFDAARLAAQCATGAPGSAAQIVAETAAGVAASKEDSALIMASVMQALNLSPMQQTQFADSVADLNCTDIPSHMLDQSSAAFKPLNPTSPGNDRNPGNPTGPGDSDDPGTTDPGFLVSPN